MKVGENLDSKNYGVATPLGHKLRWVLNSETQAKVSVTLWDTS